MLRRSVIVFNDTFSVHQRNSSLSWSDVTLMILLLQPQPAHITLRLHFSGLCRHSLLVEAGPWHLFFSIHPWGEKQSEHLCPIKLVAAESVYLLTLRLLQVFSFYTLLLLYCFSARSFTLPEHLNPLTKDRLKLFKYLFWDLIDAHK